MADKPDHSTGNVTRLPCATYLTDIPASLRALADSLEGGEYPKPESLVMIFRSHEGVSLYTQGVLADDDVHSLGMLEMAKGLVTSCAVYGEED